MRPPLMPLLLLLLLLLEAQERASGTQDSRNTSASETVFKKSLNIVLILTDDQDELTLGVSPETMPHAHAWLTQRGTTYTRAFANTPVCCPSRATLLTGRYPHQSDMTISNRVNCGGAAFRAGPEADTLGVRLQQAGYTTLYAGKYLNTYGMGDPLPRHVPPGWSQWFGLIGNSRYFNYSVSNEGVEERYHGLTQDYLTDVLTRRATQFIHQTSRPFFAWISPPATHASFTPAPRHLARCAEKRLPRFPSFNFAGTDKHSPIRNVGEMTARALAQTEEMHRLRCATLGAVDELVLAVVAALRDKDAEKDTLVVLTSDHGFHLGDFRLGFDKRQPYESDVRVPLVFAGPGVRRNRRSERAVAHVDLAPTLLEYAGVNLARARPVWRGDGASYLSDLVPTGLSSGGGSPDPHLVLLEYQGESESVLSCGSERVVFDELGRAWNAPLERFLPAPCDAWNNTYACLRGSSASFLRQEFLFCEFTCFARVARKRARVPCEPGTPEAAGEFYAMREDPHQLVNRVDRLPALALSKLRYVLRRFRTCKRDECARIARGGAFLLPPAAEQNDDAYVLSVD